MKTATKGQVVRVIRGRHAFRKGRVVETFACKGGTSVILRIPGGYLTTGLRNVERA